MVPRFGKIIGAEEIHAHERKRCEMQYPIAGLYYIMM